MDNQVTDLIEVPGVPTGGRVPEHGWGARSISRALVAACVSLVLLALAATDARAAAPVAHGSDDARWRVYFAQSFNADAPAPTFRIAQASDHSIHASNISLKGLSLTGESPNRNLIDYFQVNFDPQGAAVIGYTDDHNDFDGNTDVARQISGPSIKGGNLPGVREGWLFPRNPLPSPGRLLLLMVGSRRRQCSRDRTVNK